ncbi:MAG: tail fiber protein [Acidobacteriota bacterium]|nr:tail fiber protein [Acidobacteriota bacterium]
MFAGNFPPVGWAFCNGAPVSIAENDTLFVLIGTRYGGDGENNFNLPDLRGRVPMHVGATHNQMGEMGGVEWVTLTNSQMPNHSHTFLATSAGSTAVAPGGNVPAQPATKKLYVGAGAATVALHPQSVSPAGGSQPHDNMQPYLAINFIISLYGEFPTQT